MNIYPNPFFHELNIEIYSKIKEVAKFQIYDLQGRIIEEFYKELDVGFNEFNVVPSISENGVYFLIINLNNLDHTFRIMRLN